MPRHHSPSHRPGWPRIDGFKTKTHAVYRHCSGALIRHCGHATALWPYYGELADGSRPTMDLGGRKGVCVPKFKYLDECQSWLEEQIAGRVP